MLAVWPHMTIQPLELETTVATLSTRDLQVSKHMEYANLLQQVPCSNRIKKETSTFHQNITFRASIYSLVPSAKWLYLDMTVLSSCLVTAFFQGSDIIIIVEK